MLVDALAMLPLTAAALALLAGGFLACGVRLRGTFEGTMVLRDHRVVPFESEEERERLIEGHRGEILSEKYLDAPVSSSFLRLALFAPFVAGLAYVSGKERAQLGSWLAWRWSRIGEGLLLGIGTASFALGYSWTLGQLGLSARGPHFPLEIFGGALVVLGTVAAPVVEELYFRGRLFGMIESARGAVPALWITSILFTAMHAVTAPWLVPPYLVVSLALAWQRMRTGAITASIATHAAHNAVAIGAAMWLAR